MGSSRTTRFAHSEVQLAARFGRAYPWGVDVETFESYHRGKARKRILRLLDFNHEGNPTAGEKRNSPHIFTGIAGWLGSYRPGR